MSFSRNEDKNIFPDREPQVKVILYLENIVSAERHVDKGVNNTSEALWDSVDEGQCQIGV